LEVVLDGRGTGAAEAARELRGARVPRQLQQGQRVAARLGDDPLADARLREDVFFGYEFAIQGGELPADVIAYYVRLLSDPDALRGSLGFYRAFDATVAQNQQRKSRPLTMPVLAIGGAASYGDHVAEVMTLVADDVQSVVVPDAGHWVAEEAPDAALAALTAFLAPYRAGTLATV
jgi:pimeloyl-ACP methyl ester carboxylesterase